MGWEGIAGVVLAMATVAFCAISFSKLWEDVVEGDGLALRDASVLRSIIDHRTTLLVDIAQFVTRLGSVAVLVPVALVVSVGLWWFGQRVVVAVAPALSLIAASVVIAASKMIVGRSRPPMAWQLAHEQDASFPSGHTGNTTAVLVALALVLALVVLRRPLARLAAAVACGAGSVAMGASRLELGVHFPTDVVAGWTVGIGCAVAVTTVCLVFAARGRAVGGSSGRRGRTQARLLSCRADRRDETPVSG